VILCAAQGIGRPYSYSGRPTLAGRLDSGRQRRSSAPVDWYAVAGGGDGLSANPVHRHAICAVDALIAAARRLAASATVWIVRQGSRAIGDEKIGESLGDRIAVVLIGRKATRAFSSPDSLWGPNQTWPRIGWDRGTRHGIASPNIRPEGWSQFRPPRPHCLPLMAASGAWSTT